MAHAKDALEEIGEGVAGLEGYRNHDRLGE